MTAKFFTIRDGETIIGQSGRNTTYHTYHQVDAFSSEEGRKRFLADRGARRTQFYGPARAVTIDQIREIATSGGWLRGDDVAELPEDLRGEWA